MFCVGPIGTVTFCCVITGTMRQKWHAPNRPAIVILQRQCPGNYLFLRPGEPAERCLGLNCRDTVSP
jgi:hypothetical protein